MRYSYSFYAINKTDRKSIVYPSVLGTFEKLFESDLGEEEFAYWKNWSDDDYHEQEKKDHVYYNHNQSFELLSAFMGQTESVEALLVENEKVREHRAYAEQVVQSLEGLITPLQLERLYLNAVEGLSTYEIAKREGKKLQSVVECIKRAKKKIIEIYPKMTFST
jgi:DNA-directed RNA polymerase specialized sigma24 family protein